MTSKRQCKTSPEVGRAEVRRHITDHHLDRDHYVEISPEIRSAMVPAPCGQISTFKMDNLSHSNPFLKLWAWFEMPDKSHFLSVMDF